MHIRSEFEPVSLAYKNHKLLFIVIIIIIIII